MTRVATSVGAAAALVVVLVAGVWFFGAEVAATTDGAVLLTGAWFAVVGAVLLLLVRRRPSVRGPLIGTFVVTTVVLMAAGAYTTMHETTVDEPLVTGTPASEVAPAAVDDLLAPQR